MVLVGAVWAGMLALRLSGAVRDNLARRGRRDRSFTSLARLKSAYSRTSGVPPPRFIGRPVLGKSDIRLVACVPVSDCRGQAGLRGVEGPPDIFVKYQRPGPWRVPLAGEVEQLGAEGRAEAMYVLVGPERAPA